MHMSVQEAPSLSNLAFCHCCSGPLQHQRQSESKNLELDVMGHAVGQAGSAAAQYGLDRQSSRGKFPRQAGLGGLHRCGNQGHLPQAGECRVPAVGQARREEEPADQSHAAPCPHQLPPFWPLCEPGVSRNLSECQSHLMQCIDAGPSLNVQSACIHVGYSLEVQWGSFDLWPLCIMQSYTPCIHVQALCTRHQFAGSHLFSLTLSQMHGASDAPDLQP